MRVSRVVISILSTTSLAAVLTLAPRSAPVKAAGLPDSLEGPIVMMAEGPSLSPPVTALPEVAEANVPGEAHPALPLPPIPVLGDAGATANAVLPTETAPAVSAPTLGLNFEGITAAQGGGFAPPDTNGAVGLTQYVQSVNVAFAVFDSSTGAVVLTPRQIRTLWAGFGGDCQNRNDGDPVVLYDAMADRWVITQFALGPLFTGVGSFLQCVAVSTTGDATGTYNRYAFPFGNDDFIDYGKFGSWTDAYYGAFNTFNRTGSFFKYGKVCAFDRTAMQGGLPASMVCFNNPSQAGFLPANFNGTNPPPDGSPNPFLNILTTSSLGDWPFHVDFTTPALSTFGPVTPIPVAPFTPAPFGAVVPQLGTTQRLDAIGDRLMFANNYRTDGTTEFLVVNHSVSSGGSVAPRWYQITDPNGSPAVAQQGTFAPDSTFRWMGSINMDSAGDLAMGYSASSSSINPSIRFTGQETADPPGTMQAEATIFNGTGSQTGISRWGDYSAITVDPNDDCTFWYTTEYIPSNGSFNWRTRIASFVFPSCLGGGGSNTAAPGRH